MKLVLVLSLIVCCLSLSNVSSNKNTAIVYANENVRLSTNDLSGTRLEGSQIKVVGDEIYIDNQNIKSVASTVAIYIGGQLIGYLIEGIIIYASGYSGGELCAKGIEALVNLVSRTINITKAYFTSTNSTYVSSYITKNGQQCVRNKTGNSYVCS